MTSTMIGKSMLLYLSDRMWEPVYQLCSRIATRYFDVCGQEFLLKQQDEVQHCQAMIRQCQTTTLPNSAEQIAQWEQQIENVLRRNVVTFILNELQSKFQSYFSKTEIPTDFEDNLRYLIAQITLQFPSAQFLENQLNDLVHLHVVDYLALFHKHQTALDLARKLPFRLTTSYFLQGLLVAVSRSVYFQTELFDCSADQSTKIRNVALFRRLLHKCLVGCVSTCLPWDWMHSVARSIQSSTLTSTLTSTSLVPSIGSPPRLESMLPPPVFPSHSYNPKPPLLRRHESQPFGLSGSSGRDQEQQHSFLLRQEQQQQQQQLLRQQQEAIQSLAQKAKHLDDLIHEVKQLREPPIGKGNSPPPVPTRPQMTSYYTTDTKRTVPVLIPPLFPAEEKTNRNPKRYLIEN